MYSQYFIPAKEETKIEYFILTMNQNINYSLAIIIYIESMLFYDTVLNLRFD